MYYELDSKEFYGSKEGKTYLKLKKVNTRLGLLVTLLDNFYEEKIHVVEIIKDIENICDDIKEHSHKFDYRRKELFKSWLNDYDISNLLPLGHKSALKALEISYTIEKLLNDLDEEYQDYMYLTNLYLKQLFKYINDRKGVSVQR